MCNRNAIPPAVHPTNEDLSYVVAVGKVPGIYHGESEARNGAGDRGNPLVFKLASERQADAAFNKLRQDGRVRRIRDNGTLA